MRENEMRVLIIIPAYNEAQNIVRVVEHVRAVCPQYDYVVVNDGSADATAAICRERGYALIDLPVNLGLAGAFQTGMKYACRHDYDCAIQFDGDGQHRPEYIAAMAREIAAGFDIVIGSRFKEKKKPWSLRMLGSRILTMAIRLSSGVHLSDPTSGMRMFSRSMIEEFALNINYGPEPDTISFLLKQGAGIEEVQVEMDERIAGESYLRAFASAAYMVRMLLSIVVIQNFRKRRLPQGAAGSAQARKEGEPV